VSVARGLCAIHDRHFPTKIRREMRDNLIRLIDIPLSTEKIRLVENFRTGAR